MQRFEMIYERAFDEDQPTWCPKCQSRTQWVNLPEGQERHTCNGCAFQFIVETESAEDFEQRLQEQYENSA